MKLTSLQDLKLFSDKNKGHSEVALLVSRPRGMEVAYTDRRRVFKISGLVTICLRLRQVASYFWGKRSVK